MRTRWLLAGLAWIVLLLQAFGRDPSIIHGISIPEALMVGIVGLIALEVALGHPFQMDEQPILSAFVLWCAYGVVSWAAVSVTAEYQNYLPVQSGMKLKQQLFDYALVFVVFYFGARFAGDARYVLKALLSAVSFFTLLHVLDATGVIGLGLTTLEKARVVGIMGESNQTGVFAAAFIPVFIGVAASTRGLEKMFWLAGVPIMLTELLLTASRGGAVGVIGGAILALVLFFRYVSPARVATYGAAAVGLLAIALAVVGFQNRAILASRFIGESTATGVSDLSSGRTTIWSQILDRMAESPSSLFTGAGWDAYSVFGFISAPHNTYLGIYFNLGVIGLGCLLFILARCVLLARTACETASPEERAILIGCAIGVIGAATSSFFVDVWTPWTSIWALVALTTRLAVDIRARERVVAPVAVEGLADSGPPPTRDADAWGWRARPVSRRPIGAGRT
jgi:O-antigen ligase